MARIAMAIYSIFAYLLAMATIAYAVGFVGNYVVPKTIDSGESAPLLEALIVNGLILGLFAIQHSGMARQAFKRRWTNVIPQPVERSTYVLLSALILALLYWQWRPLTTPIWTIDNEFASTVLQAAYFLGWAIVLLSSFLISHTELFGLQQVFDHWTGVSQRSHQFRTPMLYKLVRHPIYTGMLLAFWATPEMSLGHLLFAIGTTGYVLIGIYFEERDLVSFFGKAYEDYRTRVPMLVPRVKRNS